MAEKKPLKIAIIGKAPGSRMLAPFDDPSWEIWGLASNVDPPIPKWDRWFELHDVSFYQAQVPSHWEWLTQQKCPVYMADPHPDIPGATAYPKDEIIKRFGSYFTNTVSWALALAIHEGADEIAVYGVDMAQDSEYAHQKPSCEYFIGLARGMGIPVYIPPECDLLKTQQLYAFETHRGEFYVKWRTRLTELRQREAQFTEDERRAAMVVAETGGCLSEVDIFANLNGNASPETITELVEQRRVVLNERLQLAHRASNEATQSRCMVVGALENHKWCKQSM